MNKFTSIESVDKEQPEQLRNLMKSTSMCLKSLESVGVPPKNVDSVNTYFLIRKLPAETLAYWEQMRDRAKLPSFEDLKTCIDTRIRVGSAVANVKMESHSTSASSYHRPETNNSYQSKSSTKKKEGQRLPCSFEAGTVNIELRISVLVNWTTEVIEIHWKEIRVSGMPRRRTPVTSV